MSYESKIVVAKVSKKINFGSILAELNCSRMGSFPDAFKTTVMYDVYIDDHDFPTTNDCYGDYLKDMPISEAIDYLERHADEFKNYRRAHVLLATLKAIAAEEWDGDEIRVIHYGY